MGARAKSRLYCRLPLISNYLMLTRLFSARVYYGLLLLVLGLFASTLYGRALHFDDAWFAEQAYWLRRDGYVHSELFRGLNGWENRLYVFHKGYIYALAASLRVLGESVWAVKATGLLFVALGLGLLLRYFRGQAEAQWLAAILYLGCGAVVTFGFTGRPEPMVMCCGLGSYLLLAAAADPTSQPAYGKLALAGALAGLAALTHLNGLIYLVAGALWLLSRRGGRRRVGWLQAGWFGVAGAGVAGLYLADALLTRQLPVLAQQFVHDPVNQSRLNLASKLAVLASVPNMFFHSDAELPITLVLALTLLLGLRGRQSGGYAGAASEPRRAPALRYLLLLLGAFWLLTKSATAYYLLLFVPFFIIVSVELALSAGPGLPAWRRRLLLLVLGLYPLGSLARARYLWHENAAYPPPAAENARLAAYMPRRHTKVIAPLDFIFGQFENYRIRGLTYYGFLSDARPAGPLPLADFFALAAADSVNYVVTDYRTGNAVYYIAPDDPAQIGAYRRVYQDQWHGVYARQPGTSYPAPASPKQLELNPSSR